MTPDACEEEKGSVWKVRTQEAENFVTVMAQPWYIITFPQQ